MVNEIDLNEIVTKVRSHPGITRKHPIGDLVSYFPTFPDASFRATFGEDAAVIEMEGCSLLLATDSIMRQLIDADPYWAGYCAVLVNVNDIAAMGGTPLAMVDVISYKEPESGTKIMQGIKAGVDKFRVPLVGGHTHPETDTPGVDIAILGTVAKGKAIFSHTAQVGDAIIIAVDMQGQQSPKFPLAWDSTTTRTSSEISMQLRSMVELGSAKLVTAGKDISNPGILGTIGMLLETSGKGGNVEIDKVVTPEGIELEDWVKLYQGTGFVVTCEQGDIEEVCKTFDKAGLTSTHAGSIQTGDRLTISNEDEEAILFDFSFEGITNLKVR